LTNCIKKSKSIYSVGVRFDTQELDVCHILYKKNKENISFYLHFAKNYGKIHIRSE